MINKEKNAVRNEIRQRLNMCSEEWVLDESRKICDHVLNSEEYKKADVIFCYVSFGKEVNTSRIIEDALLNGKQVGVPLCIKKGVMEVRQITSFDDLYPGMYGILEPSKDTNVILKDKIEYGLIPCVSCDQKGNRMGHGAGYYDRYLEGVTWTKAILCFDEMMADTIPVDIHDVSMDQVISQNGIIDINKN